MKKFTIKYHNEEGAVEEEIEAAFFEVLNGHNVIFRDEDGKYIGAYSNFSKVRKKENE